MGAVALPPREDGVEILAVTCIDADYTCLCHVVSHSTWKLHRVLSCGDALAFLEAHPVGIVIADATPAELNRFLPPG
jgi:hypothetical protein